MTCANWILTVIGVVTLILAIWPALLGAQISQWIVAILAIVLLIVTWTGVKCKWCEMAQKPAVVKKKR